MGNIILGFLYDQLQNVMLGLLLFWILWQFYFCFEGFGWLVWLFKIAEQVSHFNYYFFLMNTTKKKKRTDDLIRSKLHNTPECGVVLNGEHISHLICTTTT